MLCRLNKTPLPFGTVRNAEVRGSIPLPSTRYHRRDHGLACVVHNSYSRRAFDLQCPLREDLMGILGWILFGLIVGAVAKLVMPGRDPGGIIVTMLLGIAGAVLGGFLGKTLGIYGPDSQGAGLIMSVIGSIVLLLLYRMIAGRRTV